MKTRLSILIAIVAALVVSAGCNEPQSSDFINTDATNHTIEVTEKVSVANSEIILLRDKKTGNEYMVYDHGGFIKLDGRTAKPEATK